MIWGHLGPVLSPSGPQTLHSRYQPPSSSTPLDARKEKDSGSPCADTELGVLGGGIPLSPGFPFLFCETRAQDEVDGFSISLSPLKPQKQILKPNHKHKHKHQRTNPERLWVSWGRADASPDCGCPS